METLAQIYKRHCVTGPDVGHGDKGGTHSYLEVYERLLEPLREKPFCFMEIGLAMGLSIAMWREYLPKATVIGVDISLVFDPKPHRDVGTILIKADATKPTFLDAVKLYTFDVVIDDASHMSQDQMATFRLLQSKMKPGGLYIIEDILNLEACRHDFGRLHSPMEIYDLRKIKGRFDDVLVVYKF